MTVPSTPSPELALVVPGALDQRTGGYLYDARMVNQLRDRGWRVTVRELPGRFPTGDPEARRAMTEALAALPDGSRVLVDGLALGGLPGEVEPHADRLRLLALVHHPLAEETGLPPYLRHRLAAVEREALRAVQGVIVTSAFTGERLEALGVPDSRIRVAPPGTEAAPRAPGVDAPGPPVLLCVGSLVPRKGQELLVAALARLEDRAWQCILVGSRTRDPAYALRVEERIRSEGLEDRIQLTGELGSGELASRYQDAACLVLPSHYEGYGMVITEALARGLPVVATAGGAVPHTLPFDAGVLVPPGDLEALTRALGELLESRERGGERWSRLAEAALRRGRELPDWTEAGANFARAVLELAPEPEGVRAG